MQRNFILILLFSSLAFGQGGIVGPKGVIGPNGVVAPGAAATENIVRVETITQGTLSGDNLVATFGTASVANELIFVSAFVENSGQSISSCTTSGSVTCTPIDSRSDSNGSNNMTLQSFYCKNVPSGVTSVTCAETSNANATIYVTHVKGLTNGGTLDVHAITAISGYTASPWNSPAVTTTVANEYLAGGMGGVYNGANCNPSASGSWTMRGHNNDGGTGNSSSYNDQIVSTTQTNIENTGTDSGTCSHWALIATFN
jgi:hypothetical protein